MREYGFPLSVITSLLFHSIIIIILSIVIKRNIQNLEQVVYTVDLVNLDSSTINKSTEKTSEIASELKKELSLPLSPELIVKKPEEKKTPIKEENKIPIKESEVIKEEEITSEKRIAELRELMKKKRNSQETSVEARKNEEIRRFRSLADIRKEMLGQLTNETNQGSVKGSQASITQGNKYYDIVRNYIMSFWSYPNLGKKSMLAVITFNVDMKGNISNIRIEKTSGDPIYDTQAKYAVIKSNPLPIPPYEMELGIRFMQ